MADPDDFRSASEHQDHLHDLFASTALPARPDDGPVPHGGAEPVRPDPAELEPPPPVTPGITVSLDPQEYRRPSWQLRSIESVRARGPRAPAAHEATLPAAPVRQRAHRNRFQDRLSAVRAEAQMGPPPTVVDFNRLYGYTGTFHGGEVVFFIGDTGLGKSSVWQNIAFLIGRPEFSPTGEPLRVYDASMEMTEGQHARRYLQIAHGLHVDADRGVDEVSAALRDPDLWPAERLWGPLSHVAFDSVEEAPLRVSDVEERARDHGANLVIMDTLEAFAPDVPPNKRVTSYEEFELLCRQTKRMAARLGALVVVVHHLKKDGQEAASGGARIQLHHAKGPAIAAQLFDFTLTFSGQRKDVYRRLQLEKWRRHQTVDLHLIGDPRTLRFAPPTSGEPLVKPSL